eukprot:192088-Amphidinium_carterae.1
MAAQGSATISEAMLVGCLEDHKLGRVAKRRKIQSSLDKIEGWAQTLKTDVQGLVHKKVIKESVSLLTEQ